MAGEMEIGRTTGALETFIDAQYRWNARMEGKLDGLDARLAGLEKKSAVTGAIGGTLSGALVSLATALAAFWLTKGQ
jgi:hypothetical protein